jgi:hypothetical protein
MLVERGPQQELRRHHHYASMIRSVSILNFLVVRSKHVSKILWSDVLFSSLSSILYKIKSDEDRGQIEIGKLNNQNDDLDFRRHVGLKSSVLTSALVLVFVL